MKRRFFLLAAPAIVAAPSLMKVSALVMPTAEAVRVVRNPIRYGSGLYSGYDGYEILSSPAVIEQVLRTNRVLQWAKERAAQSA